jgi:hypothetical protein
VALPGLPGDNFAGAGNFEALFHAAFCFHLGHFASFRWCLSRGRRNAAALKPPSHPLSWRSFKAATACPVAPGG